MIAAIERLTGVAWAGQGPAFLVAFGHSGTHWIIGVFYVFLPFVAQDLGLTYTEAGILISIFHGAAFAANAVSGAMVDVTGRRILLQASALVVGAAALALSGLHPGMVWLAVMITVIGVTNNLWHPAAISFLSKRFPENRGYALSIHALGANLGDTAAPVAAGLLLAWIDWRAAAAVSALVPVAIAVWILAVLLPVEKVGREGGGEGMRFSDYLEGVLAMVRERSVLQLCLMAGLRSMAQNGLLVFVPLFLVGVAAMGPVMVGVSVMAMQLAGIAGAPLAGTLSDRRGRKSIVFAALAVTTAATAALAFMDGGLGLIAVIAVLGFALFASRPVIHSWLMDMVPEGIGGSATSLMFAIQSGLSAIVPVAGGAIADVYGLATVFYILAAIMFVSTLAVTVIPGGGRRE